MKRMILLALCAMTLLISACSGGGNGSGTATQSGVQGVALPTQVAPVTATN